MHINRRELFTVLPFSSSICSRNVYYPDSGRFERDGGSLCVSYSGAGTADEIRGGYTAEYFADVFCRCNIRIISFLRRVLRL